MFKDSKDTWYRQLDFPAVEFRWARRKGPGLPFILETRSTADQNLKFEYEVIDVASAPIRAYMRLTEGKIIEEMEKRVKDDKRKRDEQWERSEQLRAGQARENSDHASEAEKEQLEGGIGESQRQAEGCVTEKDDSQGDDEVQHDRLPDPVKKKRGRPPKHTGKSRTEARPGTT